MMSPTKYIHGICLVRISSQFSGNLIRDWLNLPLALLILLICNV